MYNKCEFCGSADRLLATYHTNKRSSNFCIDCIREVGNLQDRFYATGETLNETKSFVLVKGEASCDFCFNSKTSVAIHKTNQAICFSCIANNAVGSGPCIYPKCSVCNAQIMDRFDECRIPDEFENLHGHVIPIAAYRCLECRNMYETEEQRLARESRSPYVDVSLLSPSEDCLNLIPVSWMKNHNILPFRIESAPARVHVAMADPNDQVTIDFARIFFLPEMFVQSYVCNPGDLQMAFEKLCQESIESSPLTSCELCGTEKDLLPTHDTKKRISRFCMSCMKDALCVKTSGEATSHF